MRTLYFAARSVQLKTRSWCTAAICDHSISTSQLQDLQAYATQLHGTGLTLYERLRNQTANKLKWLPIRVACARASGRTCIDIIRLVPSSRCVGHCRPVAPGHPTTSTCMYSDQCFLSLTRHAACTDIWQLSCRQQYWAGNGPQFRRAVHSRIPLR